MSPSQWDKSSVHLSHSAQSWRASLSMYVNRRYNREDGCDVQVGVDPRNCVVVEDAAAGVQAARLAGEPLIADQLQKTCAALRASYFVS